VNINTLFHFSNINTDSPLSSNRVQLVKLPLRNLKLQQRCSGETPWKDQYPESWH